MQSNIIILSRHTVTIRDESDVYAAVGLGRKMTTEMGFGSGAQACAQTIIAELARNALRHGGGGTVELSALQSPSLGGTPSLGGQESPPLGGTRRGLEVVVQDRGPGIPDVSRALEGGGASPVGVPSKGARPAVSPAPAQAGPASSSGARASGAGLGVGLSSAQRLADEFTIDSIVGSGTRVRALKWDSPGPADKSRRSACTRAGRPRLSERGTGERDNHSIGAADRRYRAPAPLSRRNK